MKKQNLFFAGLFLATTVSFAGSWSDEAKVLSVDKKYRDHTIRTPYQDCYIQEYYDRGDGDGSATNELFGGIVGGAIGNKFGKGSGRDALTVAGALLGASIANDNERTGESIKTKEVCRTKYRTETESRLSHYQVEYEYQGRTFSYKSNRHPKGDTLQVRVNVTPE